MEKFIQDILKAKEEKIEICNMVSSSNLSKILIKPSSPSSSATRELIKKRKEIQYGKRI